MRIQQHISVMVVVAVGLLLVSAFVPEVAFAKTGISAAASCVQCVTPANSWCVPATSGGATCVQYANNQGQVTTVCPAPTPAYSLGDAIGTIVAFPFVAVQNILGIP